MPTLKSAATKIGLLVVSTGIAILISEFCIYHFAPQVTMFPRYVESPEFRMALPKNVEITHEQGDRWRFVYRTNEMGRRGPFIPVADEYSTRNVVVLGDSFGFGFGVNDSDTFAHTMAQQLGPVHAVINGAMVGFGIDSEVKWYFKTGIFYKPFFVVLQFTANDPFESYTGVTKIVNDDFAFFPYVLDKPAWQRFASESSIIQHSQIYSLLRKLEESSANGKAEAVDTSAVVEKYKPEQQHYNEMLRLFAHKLKDTHIELLFVSVTHRHDSVYHYDINDFPMIESEVSQLAMSGLLHHIELPLDKMSLLKGSPEGHQWSADHHQLVGTAIASEIQILEASVMGSP